MKFHRPKLTIRASWSFKLCFGLGCLQLCFAVVAEALQKGRYKLQLLDTTKPNLFNAHK